MERKLSKFTVQNAKVHDFAIIQLIVRQELCAVQQTILLSSLKNSFCQCQ